MWATTTLFFSLDSKWSPSMHFVAPVLHHAFEFIPYNILISEDVFARPPPVI